MDPKNNNHSSGKLPAGLQPLFDSTTTIINNKADSARALTPPITTQHSNTSSAGSAKTLLSPPQPKQSEGTVPQPLQSASSASNATASAPSSNGSNTYSNVFGSLPIQQTTPPDANNSTAAATGHHGRTASYGTSLLDALDEQQQQQQQQQHMFNSAPRFGHNRSFTGDLNSISELVSEDNSTGNHHFTLPTLTTSMDPFQSTSPLSSLMSNSNNQQQIVSTSTAIRPGIHARAHTLTTSPPSSLLNTGSTNASGMLGATHPRFNSSFSLTSSNVGANSLLASSSALRSSYSSNSLRTAFAPRRSSPSPSPLSSNRVKDASAAADNATTNRPPAFDFSASLDEGVWGPSRLSNELDILTTPDGTQTSFADAMHNLNVIGNDELVQSKLNHPLPHSRHNSIINSDAYARIRSYSFNGPPEGIESADEPDIDVLHAAAKSQNPVLAFRKMMARTHSRSKTLASPFANNNNGQGEDNTGGGHHHHSRRHSRRPSDAVLPGSATDITSGVQIGIGGESAAGSVSHSRHPSTTGHFGGHHGRQQSLDFEMSMLAHGASADGVPTRSLWIGNVDPGLSNQDLVAIFGKYGRVESLRLLPDKECAFVNFLRVEDAIRAKEDMHAGARIGNNTVRVGYGKGESYATGDAQAMQPTRALWVGNIAQSANPESLSQVFQQYGDIESARVLNHKNCGFVNFVRLEDAVRAKQAMNGKTIDGSVVRIGYAKVPAAKNETSMKMRNPVPSAAPLTVSGQIAEADALTGTTQSGLGSDMVLEPGFSLAIDENLVAFPYATKLPRLPEPTVAIVSDHDSSSSLSSSSNGHNSGRNKKLPTLSQGRLREVRKALEGPGFSMSKPEFDVVFAEMLPHAVDLCTDYVGNVVIQKLAERGDQQQKLKLAKKVSPYMTSIGVHKNGTWAVQKIIDTADTPEQRRIIISSIRPYTPQLLLDQLGNYVVQCCLRFGGKATGGSDEAPSDDSTNQFIYDAIHARCMEISHGRFGARAIRTCLESQHATRPQQKLVAVSLVTNSVALSTNSNGHLLMNWLLDASKFSGRFRVLAHQLAPHLRYLATHKLGASTIIKLVDQSTEPDARDLILNTLFFNTDPTVLDDVLQDPSQGMHVVLKVLQGGAIGEREKVRIAERLKFIVDEHPPNSASSSSRNGGGGGGGKSAIQKLSDLVSSILEAAPEEEEDEEEAVEELAMPAASIPQQQQPYHLGFHYMPSNVNVLPIAAGNGSGAMSYPMVNPPRPPPAGFGGMVNNSSDIYGYYYQQHPSAMPFYPYPASTSAANNNEQDKQQ